MKHTFLCLLFSVSLFSFGTAPPCPAEMRSASYRMPAQVINGGGQKSTSSSYCYIGVTGQPTAAGPSMNRSLDAQAGFIPQITSLDLNVL